MRLRTFVGLSVAAILVAGNTALLIGSKGRARRPSPGTPRVEALTPPDEARATPRAPTAAGAAVLDGPAASAPADLPRLRIVVTDSAGSPLEGARVRVEGGHLAFAAASESRRHHHPSGDPRAGHCPICKAPPAVPRRLSHRCRESVETARTSSPPQDEHR